MRQRPPVVTSDRGGGGARPPAGCAHARRGSGGAARPKSAGGGARRAERRCACAVWLRGGLFGFTPLRLRSRGGELAALASCACAEIGVPLGEVGLLFRLGPCPHCGKEQSAMRLWSWGLDGRSPIMPPGRRIPALPSGTVLFMR